MLNTRRNSPQLRALLLHNHIQGAAYVFQRFLDGRRSEMTKDMSMKFFITICYGVENLISENLRVVV